MPVILSDFPSNSNTYTIPSQRLFHNCKKIKIMYKPDQTFKFVWMDLSADRFHVDYRELKKLKPLTPVIAVQQKQIFTYPNVLYFVFHVASSRL